MTSHSSPANTSLNQDNLKRTITTPQALGISFHQIVGGGVVSLTGVAIAMTGGGVPIAYILAAVAIMLVSLPIAYLGAAMPVAGGNYTYATKLLHPLAGFANLLFFVLLMASLSLYGLTAGTYLNSLNPWFDPTVVAVSLITIFAVANLMGAAFSSKLGIYMAFVMLAAFGAFIAMGLAHVDFANYPPVMPEGLPGMLQASALLTFATGGATVVSELGREMKTPGRTIPLAIVGGTIFAALLYVLIAIPAAGVLPIAEVAGQPLSVVAQSFMPHGMWLFFILGGAVLAVIGTMNAQLLWGSKSILAAVDDGWFPAKLGTVSKRFGTPHYLIGILYLVGIVPALFHISITVIASAASVMGQLMFMIVVFASLRMRYLHPETARTAPFKVGLKLHWVLTVLGAGVLIYQTYLLSSHLTSDVVTAIGVWLAVGALWGAIRYPKVKAILAARAAAQTSAAVGVDADEPDALEPQTV